MTDRDPLNESDKQDRYDRDGDRWAWCEECAAWCEDCRGYEHRYVLTYPAIEFVNGDYGPLTFVPQPANASQEATSADLPASQPEPDQQGAPTKAKPSKALPPEIDAALTRALADAWDEGLVAAASAIWPAGDYRHERWTWTVPANPYRQEQSCAKIAGELQHEAESMTRFNALADVLTRGLL